MKDDSSKRLVNAIQSLVTAQTIGDLLERLIHRSVERAEASSGFLVLEQDLLLAEKKLSWIDLSESNRVRRGGYVFSTILTEGSTRTADTGRKILRWVLNRAMAIRRPLIIDDTLKDPLLVTVSKDETHGIRSLFCMPITKTEDIGLIYLDHPEPGHFTGELVEDLALLVEIGSVGLHNMLNESLDLMLSRAVSRFVSTEIRMERQKLIEMTLNEFKLRLGFSQVLFLRVTEEKHVAEIESAILTESWEDRSAASLKIPLDQEDDLLRVMLRDKKIASVERIERNDDNTLACHINGQPGTITNHGLIVLLSRLKHNPILAIPLYLPNGVSGVVIADKHGLPILVGKAVENFMISLSSSLSLALNWADEYQEMKTRLRWMYEERLRRETLTELASIISEVSHVIASPIKHLLTSLDALSRQNLPHEISSNILKMTGWSSKVRKYLVYIQDLARADELEPILKLNNIEEYIFNAWSERVAPFYPNVKMEIEHVDPRIQPFLFDSLQITSLFVNLFMNSARAMEEAGGTIHVEIRLDNGLVKVCVEDSGSGIPAEILCDFFNIDRRIEYMKPEKGRGKGSLICKEIIKRHGGAIEITSTGGRFVTSYGTSAGERSACFDELVRRERGTLVVVSLPYQLHNPEGV